MKISLTAREINDKGLWDKFCEYTGISVWAMNEGLLGSDESFEFDESEWIDMGIYMGKE